MRLYRCDQCNTLVDARYDDDIVKAPDGWLLLSRWGAASDDERAFEFCSTPCIVTWLKERDR